MVKLEIKIHSLEDKKAGRGFRPGKPLPEKAQKMVVGILEEGMQSGATSLMFIMDVGDKSYYSELSLDLFEGLYAAAQGAKERFGGK